MTINEVTVLKTDLTSFRILLTGASGYVGSRLLEVLRASGAQVLGYGKSPHPNNDLNGLLGDHHDSIVHFFSEEPRPPHSTIIHLASPTNRHMDDETAYRSATTGLTQALIDLGARVSVERIIYASSGLVYGDQLDSPATESFPTYSGDIHTRAKLESEEMILNAVASKKINQAIVFRMSNVFGDSPKPDTVFGRILNQVKEKKPISLHSLTPSRDFIFIDDVISAFMAGLSLNSDQPIYNVSSGQATSIRALVQLILEEARLDLSIESPQMDLAQKNSYNTLNHDKLTQATGWAPNHSLREGIRKVLQREELV